MKLVKNRLGYYEVEPKPTVEELRKHYRDKYFDKGSRDSRALAMALGAVALSVVGAAVIVFKTPGQEAFFIGFLILQLANIAFAIGQWNYQRWADQRFQRYTGPRRNLTQPWPKRFRHHLSRQAWN